MFPPLSMGSPRLWQCKPSPPTTTSSNKRLQSSRHTYRTFRWTTTCRLVHISPMWTTSKTLSFLLLWRDCTVSIIWSCASRRSMLPRRTSPHFLVLQSFFWCLLFVYCALCFTSLRFILYIVNVVHVHYLWGIHHVGSGRTC